MMMEDRSGNVNDDSDIDDCDHRYDDDDDYDHRHDEEEDEDDVVDEDDCNCY